MAQTLEQLIEFISTTETPKSVTNPIVGKVLSGLLQRPGYMGVATPATNPGTPDGGAFYLAGEAGTYPNFGGVTVNRGVLTVFTYSGTSWEAQTIDIASTLGTPEDKPAADGSAFSRILKNSDDIKTLQDMSSVVYNADLITSLSVGSSVETALVINGVYRLPVSGDTMVSATKTGVVVSSYAISTKGIFVYQIGAEITTVSFNKQTKLVTAISVSNIGVPEDSADKEGTLYARIRALQESGSGIITLEWDTDVATTRKQVPLAERKLGLKISYQLNGTTWINEQFIGPSATIEAYWTQDIYWQTIALKKDVDSVDTKLKTFFGRILEWNTDERTTKLQVSKTERVKGLIIAFNNPDKGWVIQQFIGSINVDDNFWGNTGSTYWRTLATTTEVSESELRTKKLFGRILEWNTNQSTTLNSIPTNERIIGLVVTFKDPINGWKRLQYISDTLETGALWGNQSANWKDLDAKEVDLSSIENSILDLEDNKLNKDFGKNLANPDEFEIYGYTEQGSNLANGNYYKTGFIPVRDNLVMNYEHPSDVWSSVFGKDKTKVIRTFQSKQYVKQEGDYFVRFVFNQTNRNSLQVEEGTESTEYQPFTQTKNIDEKIQEVKYSVSDTYKYTDSLCNSLHDRLSDFEEKYVQKGNAVEGLSKEAKWYDHVTQSWKTGGNMYSTKYAANMTYFSTSQTGNPNGYFIVYLDENEKFLGGFLNGLEGEKPEISKIYFLMAPLGCKYIVYQAQGGSTNIFNEANIVGVDEIYKKIESYDVLYQRKAVAPTVNFGVSPKDKEALSILFIGNSFCGQMYQYLKELTAASGHTQVIFNSVARGGKTFKYWLDDLQYKDSYPEGYLDADEPTDDGEYDTTFDKTDTLYKRLINPPKDRDGYGDPMPDRKWDIICVCGLPCQNLFDFNQDNPYTVQMVEKIRRVVQDRNIPIYLYVPPIPPVPNPAIGEESVWGNTFETSDEAFAYTNQILIDKMGNMGIPVNRLMFGSVGMQNLRKRVQINLTKTEGEIKYDSELTIDRLHPFYGLPYLVTSAICYQTILEEVFDNINAIEDMKGIRVSQRNPSDPTQIQYLNIGESNMKYAVDAVKGALLDSWNLNSYLEDGDILVIDDIKTYNEQIIAENS